MSHDRVTKGKKESRGMDFLGLSDTSRYYYTKVMKYKIEILRKNEKF